MTSNYLLKGFNRTYVRDLLKNPLLLTLLDSVQTVAVSGTSGMLVGPIIAHTFSHQLLVVRKAMIESNHAVGMVEGFSAPNSKYLIVDDQVDTGETRNRIINEIKTKFYDNECVGVFEYNTLRFYPASSYRRHRGPFYYAHEGIIYDDNSREVTPYELGSCIRQGGTRRALNYPSVSSYNESETINVGDINWTCSIDGSRKDSSSTAGSLETSSYSKRDYAAYATDQDTIASHLGLVSPTTNLITEDSKKQLTENPSCMETAADPACSEAK